jgi:hypothetical protein
VCVCVSMCVCVYNVCVCCCIWWGEIHVPVLQDRGTLSPDQQREEACLLWQSPSPSVLPCSTSCSKADLHNEQRHHSERLDSHRPGQIRTHRGLDRSGITGPARRTTLLSAFTIDIGPRSNHTHQGQGPGQ